MEGDSGVVGGESAAGGSFGAGLKVEVGERTAT